MKLEDQVVSLELAKKLKELGVEQNGYFNHIVVMPDPTGEHYFYDIVYNNEDIETCNEIICSAFTVAEFGELLPNEVKVNDLDYFFTKMGQLHCYRNVKGDRLFEIQGTQPEVEARAKMLIYLLENKLI